MVTYFSWQEKSLEDIKWHSKGYSLLLKLRVCTNSSHLTKILAYYLIHNIEANPGPVLGRPSTVMLTLITLNCRWLGNMDKFRLLLNKINKYMKTGLTIVMLQEAMIITDRLLELAWRGKYVHTPGTGNSQVCITLLNQGSAITSIQHYRLRGHSFQLRNIVYGEVLVCNIYAPNGLLMIRITFFVTSL